MLYTHGYDTLLRVSMSEWFRFLNFDYNPNVIDGSASFVVGLPSKSYKPIPKTTWVPDRLCKLQNRVHSNRSRSHRGERYPPLHTKVSRKGERYSPLQSKEQS